MAEDTKNIVQDTDDEDIVYIQGETPKRKFPVNFKDKIQVCYEMLRTATLSKEPIEKICSRFGYSKRMYYYYMDKFQENGIMGLAKEKTGPKKPHKRTDDLEKRVIELRFNYPDLNMYDILYQLKEEDYDVSPSTVARVLKEHGLTKKKRKKKSQSTL